MIAHIRHSDKAEQSIGSHAHAVAVLCRQSALQDGLSAFAFLIGLLHDLGKCTGKFRDYLRHQVGCPEDPLPKNTAVHTPSGAIFAYERWHHGDYYHLLTAEIVSLVIRSHHGGLIDMLDLNGESRFLLCLQNDKKEICYDEAVNNFLCECISETELDELFIKSCYEVAAFIEQINPKSPMNVCFQIHFLCRLMLSYLVDADRLDSACFDAGIVPDPPCTVSNVWSKGIDALEAKLASIQIYRHIDSIRHDISNQCFHAGKGAQGIYSLTVPTGGGKTLSSLRFAMAHAKEHDLEHIFYIVPYNTILEQNAQVVRGIIKEDDVLEHHCNVVFEDEMAETYHHRLTERWDVPVILTSMVQFLNTLFRHGNTDSRRMHQLCRSVIIFDEIQALPAKCYHLLQLALDFLTRQGKSTVLLCTATQPLLCHGIYAPKQECHELIADVGGLFKSLRRTVIHDETEIKRSITEAAKTVLDLQQEYKSVLIIVNTKKAASWLYELVQEELKSRGTVCVFLSTSLCAAHRLDKLNEMLKLLYMREEDCRVPVVCISTSLIEAGVDISFPCVVRSYAGLPSMIQAAGRCNRNGETEAGHVYLWNIPENLAFLKAIEDGQRFSRKVQDQIRLGWAELDGGLASPQAIQWYYRVENQEQHRFDYQYSKTDLIDLLSINSASREMWSGKDSYPFKLSQAFQTAEKAFSVIDQNTETVLVPYKDGIEIIELFKGKVLGRDSIRKAQQFSVQIFPHAFEQLKKNDAVYQLGDTGVYALKPQYYRDDTGLLLTQDEMEKAAE